jgi:flagellar assembly protein FliH
MQKYRNSDIKPFEFSDLQGTQVNHQGDFKPFSFHELSGEVVNCERISEESLRSERSYEQKNNFKIDGNVRNSRGLVRQEQSDMEQRIEQELNRRLETAFQQAYNEGLEKGREIGRQSAFDEYQKELAARIENFSQTIESLNVQNERILEKNRHEIFDFIKRFTKWVVLKEIDEKTYLESLLEKLILELNARKNLIVKVGRNNFSQMPEVIKHVEARIGQLSNVRVEIVPEIHHPGIILESENGLIDGSLEGVFQNIDRIFEQMNLQESST